MLVDEAEINIKAGHGGKGLVAFQVKKGRGPNGGDGGKGGDVYVAVNTGLYGLSVFLQKSDYDAEDGQPGGNNKSSGSNGNDLTLEMPLGTVLIDKDTGEEIELYKQDQRVLIAKGGLGGKGNFRFRSSTNTTPKYAQPGLAGEAKRLKLELRLIADFGLIGLPNAGKSSLLNEITNAKARVGDYPFTTLEPNLGVLKGRVIADIPGLIEGASQGKGLGHSFLKHIEKVALLIHCIPADSTDLLADYKTIRNELEKYNPELLDKKELILLTKTDLLNEAELKEKIKTLKKLKREVVPVSIHNLDSLQKFIASIGLGG